MMFALSVLSCLAAFTLGLLVGNSGKDKKDTKKQSRPYAVKANKEIKNFLYYDGTERRTEEN